MNRDSKWILAGVLLSVNALGLAIYDSVILYSQPYLPPDLKWYHNIDCSIQANGETCIHIANECVGTALIRPDGVYCY